MDLQSQAVSGTVEEAAFGRLTVTWNRVPSPPEQIAHSLVDLGESNPLPYPFQSRVLSLHHRRVHLPDRSCGTAHHKGSGHIRVVPGLP